MIGIYKITNLLNGKSYIGQSKNIENRWRNHRWRYKYKEREHLFLYQAMRRYGIENFSFEVLEECNEEDLDALEIKYIEQYRSFPDGYNMTGGGNGHRGRPMTPEGKAALLKALTGRPCSEETRRRISEAQKGKTLSKEQRAKISEFNKKRWEDPEYRAKMHAVRMAYRPTEETRRKIGASHKGRKLSEQHRRRLIEANTGRVFSEEHREKLRIAHLGKHPSEETRKKMSEAFKGRVFTDEWRAKLSCAAQNRTEEHQQKLRDCKKGAKNPMARSVECDGVIYETLAQCATALNVPKSTLWRWLNGKPEMPVEYQKRNLRYHQF